MPDNFQERIASALSQVRNRRLGTDVLSAEMVRDVGTTTSGKIRLTLLLAPTDDATLVRDVRQALEAIDGVTDVRIDVRDASQADRHGAAGHAGHGHPPGHTHGGGQPPAHQHGGAMPGGQGHGAAPPGGRAQGATPSSSPQPGRGRALPVMTEQPAAPPRPAAPTPSAFPNLGRMIAISSGKGGVGKSTIATNLAVALAQSGARVGLMDADIYGPNIPRMMGVNDSPPVVDERIQPLQAHGVKVMSLGFIIERDQPAIWRGPIVMKIIQQFLRDVQWGELDYFLVDMPPGTGDAQLSLVQTAQVHGALIVTTPQAVAVGDALRGVKMFQRVGVPVLGIIENMSWLECEHCGKPSPIFGSGGGQQLATEVELPLLGQIPLYPPVQVGGDRGMPIVVGDPRSSAARALKDLAGRVAEQMGALAAP